MATPTIVQDAEILSPSATPVNATTSSGILTTPATAGNALALVLAGDKDTGTATVADDTASGTWSVPIPLTSAQVSLYLAWKTAVGGEDTVTVSHGLAAQGCTGWLVELAQGGSGAWTVAASATNGSDGTTAVAFVATGTTGAATYEGLAIAGAAVDSITSIRSGTQTWTPSPDYTSRYAPPFDGVTGSGGGSAGAYVATAAVAQGATTSATLTSSSGTDQMSGAVLVLGRVAGGEPPVDTAARTRGFLTLL